MLTETLITDAQVPQVDPQVVRRDISLAIRVDRDRVDMVRVGVCVYFSRHSGNDVFLHRHSRQA